MKKFLHHLQTYARNKIFQAFVPLTGFQPLADVSGSKLGELYSGSDMTTFINNLFTFAISIGAILAVLRLVWAGYLYMTTDNWGSKGRAKEVIGDVTIGLLLLLAIYLILFQINPDLLELDVLRSLEPLKK